MINQMRKQLQEAKLINQKPKA